MKALNSTPGALRLLLISVVARVPLATLAIGLLVHTVHLTGSFAAAGVVTAANAVALGVGGPLLGKLVDRRGQTPVLLVSGCAAAVLLCAAAALPVGAPLPVLVGLAGGIGLAVPPLGACVRSLLPSLVPDSDALRGVYAVEATAVEFTWIAGPPLVLGLGTLWSTGAALAAAGVVLLVGTAAFAVQPASRAWRPAGSGHRPRGGALRTPAMQTLVIVLVAVGVLFGAAEVGVAAAASALGSSGSAGPLLGLWGAGSLAGGALAARLGGGLRGAAGLALMLTALAAGHLGLVLAAGNVFALGAVLFIAGAAIAPAYATVYAMVDEAAPPGAVTEAFAWLSTAVAIGAAAGAAVGGAVADGAGPAAAFALAGGAGLVAVLVTLMRSPSLAGRDAQAVAASGADLADRAVAAAAA
jgi:MFS family permease